MQILPDGKQKNGTANRQRATLRTRCTNNRRGRNTARGALNTAGTAGQMPRVGAQRWRWWLPKAG
eukprot:655366-Lingulodinium_polyedra.AAC.1